MWYASLSKTELCLEKSSSIAVFGAENCARLMGQHVFGCTRKMALCDFQSTTLFKPLPVKDGDKIKFTLQHSKHAIAVSKSAASLNIQHTCFKFYRLWVICIDIKYFYEYERLTVGISWLPLCVIYLHSIELNDHCNQAL